MFKIHLFTTHYSKPTLRTKDSDKTPAPNRNFLSYFSACFAHDVGNQTSLGLHFSNLFANHLRENDQIRGKSLVSLVLSHF